MQNAEAGSAFRSIQHTGFARLLLRGFLLATKYLPVWLLRAVGFFVAGVFLIFNRENFRTIIVNLKTIEPGLTACRYAAMAFGVFKNYAWYLIDLFHISHDISRIRNYKVRFSGLEHLDDALTAGKGVLLLTAHLGNWEIGGIFLSMRGQKIHVVYFPDSSGMIEQQRRFVRALEGIEEIPLSEGSFLAVRLLRVLQEGGTVALQGDRLTFDSGVPITFFGKNALFPKGPVKLALASDSVVLPVFMPIAGYKAYEIIIDEPIAMERMNGAAEELRTNLTKVVEVFERRIGTYPTQWFTFMPFWTEGREDISDT